MDSNVKDKEGFYLPNRKVLVKPILKKGEWLPVGHSGQFMYDNSKIELSTPISGQSGKLVEVLNAKERKFFEENDNLDFNKGDLSAMKGKGNYWLDKFVRLQKPEDIVKDDTVLRVLDLSNPVDYIDYKILLANSSPLGGMVAPTFEQRYHSATYKIMLVNEEYQTEQRIGNKDKMKKIYKFIDSIDSSKDKMYKFLSIYWLNIKSAKQPPKDGTMKFLEAEIEKIIESNPDGIVNIINDKDYELKATIIDARECGEVIFEPHNGFTTAEGEPMGKTINDVVTFLKDTRNQDTLIKIEAQIKQL